MPSYALADECIDEMRKVVKKSAGPAVRKNGAAEAKLCQELVLRLKQSPDDEGVTLTLPHGATLNFFRHEAAAMATVAQRKNTQRNLDHFFIQSDDQQYTLRTVFKGKSKKILGVMVAQIKMPRDQFPPDTEHALALRAFSG